MTRVTTRKSNQPQRVTRVTSRQARSFPRCDACHGLCTAHPNPHSRPREDRRAATPGRADVFFPVGLAARGAPRHAKEAIPELPSESAPSTQLFFLAAHNRLRHLRRGSPPRLGLSDLLGRNPAPRHAAAGGKTGEEVGVGVGEQAARAVARALQVLERLALLVDDAHLGVSAHAVHGAQHPAAHADGIERRGLNVG